MAAIAQGPNNKRRRLAEHVCVVIANATKMKSSNPFNITLRCEKEGDSDCTFKTSVGSLSEEDHVVLKGSGWSASYTSPELFDIGWLRNRRQLHVKVPVSEQEKILGLLQRRLNHSTRRVRCCFIAQRRAVRGL